MRLISEVVTFACIFGLFASVPSIIVIAVLRLISPERWPKAWVVVCLAAATWCIQAILSATGHYQRTLIAWAQNDYYMIWVSYLPWFFLFAPSFPVLMAVLVCNPKRRANRDLLFDSN
jgi:hypothetical protein